MPRNFGHRAVLHRSVCSVIRTALHWSLTNRKVFGVGGMDNYRIRIEDLLDLYWFSVDMSERMRHNRLTRGYGSTSAEWQISARQLQKYLK